MIAWLLHRGRDPIVVKERIKMMASCLNLIAIGVLVGSAIGPIFNTALMVPLGYRIFAVLGFFVLEGCAMIVLRFLPDLNREKED